MRACILFSECLRYLGLSGIDMGSSLIKSVVAQLQKQFPGSLTGGFYTLSPIPGFKKWLKVFHLHKDYHLIMDNYKFNPNFVSVNYLFIGSPFLYLCQITIFLNIF
jgi:hypothetical protein